MKLGEYKRKLLDTGLFQKVSNKGQYVCKTCPYCGDTKKHFYVYICQEDDSPVLYHCFKCLAGGFLDEKFMEYFGIDDIEIPKYKGQKRIKTSDSDNVVMNLIDENADADMLKRASLYIEKRVGFNPSVKDMTKFQVIGNPEVYIQNYLGGDTRGLRDRVWFRLNNGSIIGRKLDSDEGMRWKKRTPYSTKEDAGIYVIKQDVYVNQTINICICEGIMDAIGLYYYNEFEMEFDNAVYIACMGRDYSKGIQHALGMGIFGDSVNILIFKDNDVEQVRIKNVYRKMFKKIEFYHNTLAKDFGVSVLHLIELEKCDC